MTIDVVDAARRRLDVLRTETRQLEAFIEMSEQLASGRTGPLESDALDGIAPRVRRHVGSPRPRDVAAAVHAILSDGATLDQHELVDRLRRQDIVMTGANPAKNLATILWRNRSAFEHVRGEGYRLTGAPL
jgi:hypothetical protein